MGEFNGNPFWPVWYRILQTGLEAAPTLLCGLVLAGLIRGMIRPDQVRRLFGDDPRLGPIRACLLGFLLPVCSFGVLPVAWELKRAGVARATVLTFLLSAPIANPISLGYAWQKLSDQGALATSILFGLILGAFVVLAGLGILWSRLLPESTTPNVDLPTLPADPARRLFVAGLAAARGATGILVLFLLVGLLGSGLLALHPGGALERAAYDGTRYAPLHMALMALPAQIPPEKGGFLLCDMLLTRVPLGIAFVFLTFGVGMNLGTLIWIPWVYGTRVAVCILPATFGALLLVGYALPLTLPNLANDSGGRHFLEIEISGGADIARARALEDTLTNEKGETQWLQIGACAVLGALFLTGIVCRVIGEAATPEFQMTRPSRISEAGSLSPWTRRLGAPQLALVGLGLGLIVVLGGFFIAYPAPSALLNEMSGVQVELNLALKSKSLDREQVLSLIAQWQRLQNKLLIGDFLRRGRLNSPLRQPAEELRAGIARLRTALIEDKPPEELASLYAEARKAANRCREAAGQSIPP